MTLSADELAARSGTGPDRIQLLVEVGVLERREGGFRSSDVQRVRVTEALGSAGITPEDLGRLIGEGWFSFEPTEALFFEPVPVVSETMQQVCHEMGIPRSLAERALTAWAVPLPGPGERLRADDRSFLGIVARVYEILGRDEDLTIAGTRYFGENLRRIAESQMRWFRDQVVTPALVEGATQAQLTPMIIAIASRLLPIAREVVMLGYQRHVDHYSVEVTVGNIETAFENAGFGRVRPSDESAIAFVDLTGFTSLTEREGDAAAAAMADRLVETVRRMATEAGGRAIKFMGDGAMLQFDGPAQAVRCALDLVDEIPRMGLPEAHAGVNAGPVVFSDGDYFGRTVNLASRMADRAGPHQVLVASGVLDPMPADLEAIPLGPVTLEGLAEPVALDDVVRATTN